MHLRILTSCTSKKAVSHPDQLTGEDFDAGGPHLQQRKQHLEDVALPAGEMYTGQQHQHLMRGVNHLRRVRPDASVEVGIISAGLGLVMENEPIVPYERTFSGRSKREIIDLASSLQVPVDARRFLKSPADLSLLLLGTSYLTALRPDDSLAFGGPTLAFAGREGISMLPDHPHLKKVTVTQEAAKRFSQGLVWLKGFLARRLLKAIAQDPTVMEQVLHPDTDVLSFLEGQDRQVSLGL